MTDSPALDVLLHATAAPPRRLEPREDEAELVALLDDLAPGRSVRANMIATLDGAATGPDRVTGSINGPADLRVFTALRALADVVLVGAGTVRQERYRELDLPSAVAATRRAHGRGDRPALAVVTRSGDVPGALLDAERPPLVVTCATSPRVGELRDRLGDGLVVAGRSAVDLRGALAALAERGLTAVLTEGGPTLLGQLVSLGLVDELFLTWSPTVVGGPAPRVLDGAPWVRDPLPARLVQLLHADGVLLGRWDLRTASQDARSQLGSAT